MRIQKVYVVIIFVLLASSIVFAGVQARIEGTVKDSSGNPLTEAVVIITSSELANYHKEIKVDKKGKFKALLLDATKKYLFLVEAPGYQAQERPFKVGAGSDDNFFAFVLNTKNEAIAREQTDILEEPGYKQLKEGVDLMKEGRTEEARAKFVEAIEAEPELIQALAALAGIDFESGRHEEALATARKCLELDDESNNCLAIAADASRELGDDEAYADYLARYKESNPDSPSVLFNNAVGFLNKMDDEGARPFLEQCLEADPDYPKCLFEYGMLLMRSGDMTGAKSNLEHFVQVAPEAPDAVTAREIINYL